jgi:hypothetical protein
MILRQRRRETRFIRFAMDPRKPSKPSRLLEMQEKVLERTQLPLIFHFVSYHDRVHVPHITQHLIPGLG